MKFQFQKTGVLLVNVGTPDSPSRKDVRKYLREFLNDKRVIDIPAFYRLLLLYLIILPFRVKRSAKLYTSIWRPEGSPLSIYSKNLLHKVRDCLGAQYHVELGMAYQNPSLECAVENLLSAGVDRIVIFPLFPQYASATTGAVLEKAAGIIHSKWNVPSVASVPAFYAHPSFIKNLSRIAREQIASFEPEHILFSYHGLPEKQIQKSGTHSSFRYDQQCFETTKLLAAELQLKEHTYSSCFQSRLGRAKWTEPNINTVLPELAQKGVKRLAILCPSFVADCLETLEEIGMGAKAKWQSLGGEDFLLIPCLNADSDWAQGISQMIQHI